MGMFAVSAYVGFVGSLGVVGRCRTLSNWCWLMEGTNKCDISNPCSSFNHHLGTFPLEIIEDQHVLNG